MLEGDLVDERRGVLLRRNERLAVARIDQLNSEQEAAAAHLPHDVEATHGCVQLLAESGAALGDPRDEILVLKGGQHGETDGAEEGCAVPGVAVLELARARGDGVVHVLGAEDAGQRRVTRPECLPEGDDVRHERELLVSEPRARAPEAGHDLVEDDEKALSLAPLGEPLPKSLRRRITGERRGRDRLADEGCDGVSGPLQDAVKLGEGVLASLVEARRDVEVVREVGAVGMPQPVAARERKGPEGRAVVGLRRRDDPPAPVSALGMEGAHEADRHLVRLRAARDEARSLHLGSGHVQNAPRELLLPLVRELVVVDVGEPLGLPCRSLREVEAAVAEASDHCAASASVQDLAAVGAIEADALAAVDVRIGPVQVAREDAGLVGADRGE
jgi:hypothetical protein